MKLGSGIWVMLLFFCFSTQVRAQGLHKLEGVVQDSTGQVVRSALVELTGSHDTLRTTTDSQGQFSFAAVRTINFTLRVSSLGYQPLSRSYAFNGEEELQLQPLTLQPDTRMLNEVTIRDKVQPVKIKKDTVEYNAAAYHVLPNDRVSELLRQLPGVSLDADSNITVMGKKLTKIRVNGKDFFTGNVKTFIEQLPADLVSKIQIIDDYGDRAAFTGVKTGKEPTKLLNLVTKKKRNSGKFGDIKLDLGSNRQYGLEEKVNLWEDGKQLSLNSGVNRADNGAGKSAGKDAALSYRDSLGKANVLSAEYTFAGSHIDSRQQSLTETVTGVGSIFGGNNSSGTQTSSKQQLVLGLKHQGKTDLLDIQLSGSLAPGSNTSLSQLSQNGLIAQDQTTGSSLKNNNQEANATLQYSHLFAKPGRSLSIYLAGGTAPGSTDNYQDNHIQYFDPATHALQKDSLLDLRIDNKNRTNSLFTLIGYNEPLGKRKEGVHRTLDLNYSNTANSVRNSLLNSARDAGGTYIRIDSLSNSYRTLFTSQAIGATYVYADKQLEYILGVSARNDHLSGSYASRPDRVETSSLNLLPLFYMGYHSNSGGRFLLYYSSFNSAPNFSQLQPLPDNRNLQNVVIGNPDLKTPVAHNGILSYEAATEGGRLLLLSATASTTRNKVVSNILLVADTLNSLKQQTRYLNSSGNYTTSGNYTLSLPFAGNKYGVTFLGNLGYSKDSYYSNNLPGTTEGINYSQGLKLRATGKWMILNMGANYSFSANRYSLGMLNPGNLRTWAFTSDARFTVTKSFKAGLQVNKMIREGYALAEPNPMIVNLFTEAQLFKRKQGSIKLQAFDLLNQGDNQQRTVSGNTITDSQTNQVRRYFQLSFMLRLDQFGQKGGPQAGG